MSEGSGGFRDSGPPRSEFLERLPTDYAERIEYSYQDFTALIAEAIAAGKLPAEYEMPGLESFEEEAIRLAPSFEFQNKHNWQPEVVFVREGFSSEQWNGLFTDDKTVGVTGIIRNLPGEPFDPI